MRLATKEDIPRLVEMGWKFHAASNQKCGFNPDDAEAMLGRMIEADIAVVIVSDAGAIGGVLNPAYCDTAWIMAVELFWWAEDRQGLRLLSEFERWALEKGAHEIRMTTLTNLTAAERILVRKGYAASEISYQKVT